MHASRAFAPFLFSFITLTACQLQQPLTSQPRLRNATIEDADDIATVVIAAFSPTPPWKYIYQFSSEKPKEHHRCVRYGVMQGLTSPDYHAEVIEAPYKVKGGLSVVAAALWQPNYSSGEDGMGMFMSRIAKQCQHRDMNLTRAIPFGVASAVALEKYVKEPFGPTQLYLDMIAVHPDYQLHGAGTRLVSRGVEIGRKEGFNVTLVALPSSEGFYAHIGWKSWTNFTIDTVDGGELRYDVMAYDFEGEA